MENYKFKRGDRVEVVKLRDTFHNRDTIKLGITGTVIEDRSERPWVEFDDDIFINASDGNVYGGSNILRTMCMWEDEIDFIRPIIKKSDLKGGDIVTYRKGSKRIVDIKNKQIVCLDNLDNLSFVFNDFNEDLMKNDYCDNEFDIVEVYRPETKETFHTERTKQVKEMTLKEVCKELGYEVKIVKEEN